MPVSEAKKPVTKLSEVPSELLSLSSQLEALIDFRQGELKRLQHEATLEAAQKAALKREGEQLITQARMEARQIVAEASASLEEARKALHEEQRAVEFQRLELDGRAKEVAVLEEQAEGIRAELKTLNETRIAIEQQRLRNDELLREHARLSDINSTLQAELERRQKAIVSEETRQRAQAGDLDQRESALAKAISSANAQLENLTALKKTIDPKLAEVTRLSQQAESDKAQAEVLRQETVEAQAGLDKQRSDLSTLSSQLQAKGEALVEFEARLKRFESELRIKAQQAGVKAEKVPTHKG